MFARAIVLAFICSLALGASLEDDIGQQPTDDRVTIELYYESLCPFCHKFMTEQLIPVLAKPVLPFLKLGNLVDSRLQVLSLR